MLLSPTRPSHNLAHALKFTSIDMLVILSILALSFPEEETV